MRSRSRWTLVFVATCIALSASAQSTRTLTVKNSGDEPIWIGASGGSVVPACSIPGGTVCLADPSRTSNGDCACVAGQPLNGALVCPPTSTPTSDGKFCTCDPGTAAACGGAGTTTACSEVSDPKRCFWTMPAPAASGPNPWLLLNKFITNIDLGPPPVWPVGTTKIVSPVWWSGGIFARTGCRSDGTECATADCGALPNGTCPPGVGGSNPFSQAEFTLQTGADDFYDITVINGVNVTVEMAPSAGQSLASAGTDGDPKYWCSNPGGTTSSTGLGGCSWTFDPTVGGTDETTLLLNSSLPCSTTDPSRTCPTGFTCSGAPGGCFAACSDTQPCPGTKLSCVDGYCQCDDTSDCAPGQVCGTQFVPGIAAGFLQQCGAFAGWWTANDLCAQRDQIGPLDCTGSIPDGNGTSTTTLRDLFQCVGNNASSCYNGDAQPGICCGCATDPSNPLSSSWPPVAKGDRCVSNDPVWAARAQPWLAYLKTGCPTAYTYAFDDATSTFKCQTQATPNQVSYTVTFSSLARP